jgi:uncharacterized tellurite resistance protein B-like protein
MLSGIREFFEKRIGAAAAGGDARHAIQLATAALLVEVGRLDSEIDASEREAMLRAVRGNRHFSQEQRQRVVELMWQVAYADAELSAHEQHVVRKIADLLYVPHAAYIAAKLRARDAAGG